MIDPIQFVPLPPPDEDFTEFFASLTAAIDKALALPEDLEHLEEQSFAE